MKEKELEKSTKKKSKIFKSPKGMHDLLPEDQVLWDKIFNISQKIVKDYGFSRLETPIVEEAMLFTKGIGQSTELIERQMYTFKTRGRDFLALRPEYTAGIARSYIEHGMASFPQPVKVYSFGPLFRYEQPQHGRFRQFWQFDVEVLGDESFVYDAQIILINVLILKALGFKDLKVDINSIGDDTCRPNYIKALKDYYRSKTQRLCRACKKRIKDNPLRVLDCKEQKCSETKESAPHILDHLCQACHNHLRAMLEILEDLELSYALNPHLVRGFDYYTKTVFEIFYEKDESRLALSGGGRYDKLIEALGGPMTSAVGFAMGVERIAELLKTVKGDFIKKDAPEVFVAHLGDLGKRKALKIFEFLRKEGFKVAESFGRDSIRAQLKTADRLEAPYVLILGQKEILSDEVILRDMKTGTQETILLKKLTALLERKLSRK